MSKGSAAKRWSRGLRHAALDAFARSAFALAPLIPFRVATVCCGAGAWLARWLSPGARRDVHAHLAKAFPETPAAVREAMLREVYATGGRLAAETLKAHQLTDARLDELVTLAGAEHIRAAKGDANDRGAVFATLHLCNWELLARYVVKVLGWRLVVVARRQDEGLEVVIGRLRERNGLEVLHRGEGLRPLIRAAKDGATVAALVDQSIRGSTVPIEFFGHPALAHDGFARLAIMADVPVVPMGMWRRRAKPGEAHWGGWRFEAKALPPILPRGANGKRRSPEEVCVEASAALESLIREAPGQWMWFHDRWHVSRRDQREKAQAAAGDREE